MITRPGYFDFVFVSPIIHYDDRRAETIEAYTRRIQEKQIKKEESLAHEKQIESCIAFDSTEFYKKNGNGVDGITKTINKFIRYVRTERKTLFQLRINTFKTTSFYLTTPEDIQTLLNTYLTHYMISEYFSISEENIFIATKMHFRGDLGAILDCTRYYLKQDFQQLAS